MQLFPPMPRRFSVHQLDAVSIGFTIRTPASVAVMSLPSMRKSSKYECRLLLFLAVVIFPTLKTANATDARSKPATVANDAHAGAEIPTGFKLERYARVWERNPFTLVTPTAPPSAAF